MRRFFTKMAKRKNEPITKKRKWNRQIKFYHNKGSGHFLLGIAEKGDYVAGHDLTTHPSLKKEGQPKNKYYQLNKNPNLEDKRISFINKRLRKDVRKHFPDTGRPRLTVKKKWKLSKRDKKKINKIDRRAGI